MKIICTKSEFAMLIRNCQYDKCFEDCKKCWFQHICSEMNAMTETEIMSSIEDICLQGRNVNENHLYEI